VQQLGFEPAFQIFDLLANGRLCNEVSQSSAGKASAFDQIAKNF